MSQSTTSSESTAVASNSRSIASGPGEIAKNQHKASIDFPFAAPFGSGADAWWSSSVWASQPSSGLGSRAVTRDSSRVRDAPQQSSTAAPDDVVVKTGSASLVESSVSEENSYRSAWDLKPTGHTSAGRASSQVFPYADPPMQQQQRSLSTAGLSQPLSGSNQQLSSFVSNTRPPTINLNATSSFHSRPSVGSSFSSTLSGRGCEQQPPFNVYTKFDRPAEPLHRKPDSAVGTWGESSTTPSPSDERRTHFASQFTRNTSLPASRDGSLPPARLTDDFPLFTRPDYSRPAQQVTPASSRAPSISSRNGAYGAFLTPGADSMASHFGKVSLNGDSRPSTSYKSVGGHSSHPSAVSVASSATRPSLPTPYSDRTRPDYFSDADRPASGHRKSDSFASMTAIDGLAGYHPPALSDRFSQPYNNFDYQHNQNFANGGFPARLHDATISRPSSNFHGTPSPRRPQNHADQHAFLDQRIQHMMANQLRNPYATAMYSPYAIQNALQMGATPPYMGMLPYTLPGMDATGLPRDTSATDGVQSALLFEFKSNPKAKRYELRDIYDHVVEFSGDQFGSRFIQTKLETANSDEKDRVFREIEPNVMPLMTDVFGNYVIQKFFEHGDQRHKKILANKMRGEVLTLSLQMYGCRVVQKALDHVLVDQQALLVSELENHVLRCVKDQNGNHVIQKAIERCPPTSIGFIISAFHGQVQHLSIHPYGCRVIQRCLEKCDLPAKALILAELKDGIPSMISDQFGNYVVQHIVSHDDGEAKQLVLNVVARGLEAYSKHKFASNVVETCIERADDYWRREVLVTLAQSNQRRGEGDGVLVNLIKDNFGNYVIQKLLDTLHADDYHGFLELLRPAMNLAKRSGCGKQVLSIEKKMHKFHPHQNLNNTTNSITNGTYRQHSFQTALPTPPIGSNYNSATTTPPLPLSAPTADIQSLQSSSISAVNGDTVGGATVNKLWSDDPALQDVHN